MRNCGRVVFLVLLGACACSSPDSSGATEVGTRVVEPRWRLRLWASEFDVEGDARGWFEREARSGRPVFWQFGDGEPRVVGERKQPCVRPIFLDEAGVWRVPTAVDDLGGVAVLGDGSVVSLDELPLPEDWSMELRSVPEEVRARAVADGVDCFVGLPRSSCAILGTKFRASLVDFQKGTILWETHRGATLLGVDDSGSSARMAVSLSDEAGRQRLLVLRDSGETLYEDSSGHEGEYAKVVFGPGADTVTAVHDTDAGAGIGTLSVRRIDLRSGTSEALDGNMPLGFYALVPGRDLVLIADFMAEEGRDGTAVLVNLRTGEKLWRRSFDGPVVSVAASPNGRRLAVALHERRGGSQAVILDLEGQEVLRTVPEPRPLRGLWFVSNTQLILGATGTGQAQTMPKMWSHELVAFELPD